MVVVSPYKTRSYDGDYMALGRQGMSISMDFLKDHPQVIGVEDLSELRPLQRVDSDLLMLTDDGQRALVECKTDVHVCRSGNIVFEVARINHRTSDPRNCVTLGWSVFSNAPWVFYYGPQGAYIYQFSTDALRRTFQRYTGERRHNSHQKWISTDDIKSTLVVLIPLLYFGRNDYRIHDAYEYALRHLSPEGRTKLGQQRLLFREPVSWAGASL